MESIQTVLVTGGSGFIGSHLVCALLTARPQWRVLNLDVLDYCCSPRSLISVQHMDNYCFIQGDVCDQRLVSHLFNTEDIDVVFHLAAMTHVETSYLCPSLFQRVNVEGTRVVLAAARGAGHALRRFVYVSTDEVYGGGGLQVFDEDSPLRPSNPYSATKAAAECLVQSYWDEYKFPVIVTRSNNVYGPRQYPEKVIPRFVSLLQANKKCTIQGSSPKSRHFLYVDDVIEAFLLVLAQGVVGGVYNMGVGHEVPILQLARELVTMIQDVPETQLSDWLDFVPDRPRLELRYPISSEKLRGLGWRPRVPWTEGLRRTVEWYKSNPDFWPGESEDRGNGTGIITSDS
ncbi:dTDP-D-glucose 4,6-dehydratase isoform X1 [Gadus morhua]|uniref:dTDP-D-glucose 4,6-dehydratase n=1 Tax=Gadus morhua TaxID=8049 RepID=A0A8C4Z177_GADMO|nr:dTDP-D-glucose 4,6-dehydratase isoform X1 [Gadus morhua]